MWNGKAGEGMKVAGNVMLLTGVWMLLILPVVTVGPATAALFAVLHDWHEEKSDSAVRRFFYHLKEQWKNGFLLGNVWVLGGIILMLDVVFMLNIEAAWRIVPLSVTVFAVVMWALFGTALFPSLLFSEQKRLTDLIKETGTAAFSDWQTSTAILLLWVGAAFLFVTSPVLLLLCIVPLSWLHLRFSLRSREADRLKQNHTHWPHSSLK